MKIKEIKNIVEQFFITDKIIDGVEFKKCLFLEECFDILAQQEYVPSEMAQFLSEEIEILSNYENGGLRDEKKEALKLQYEYLMLLFTDDIDRYRTQNLHPFEVPNMDYCLMDSKQLRRALKSREERMKVMLVKLNIQERNELTEDVGIYLQALPKYIQGDINREIIKRFKLYTEFEEKGEDLDENKLFEKNLKSVKELIVEVKELFRNVADYEEFAIILAKFFCGMNYSKSKIFPLHKMSKVKIALVFNPLYKELGIKEHLSNDKEYLDIIKMLQPYNGENYSQVYKAITRL